MRFSLLALEPGALGRILQVDLGVDLSPPRNRYLYQLRTWGTSPGSFGAILPIDKLSELNRGNEEEDGPQ